MAESKLCTLSIDFASLCRQAQLHIFTRRQPLFTE